MDRGRQNKKEDKMPKLPKKCRYCRQEGEKLYLKGERCFSPKCPIDQKGAVAPGDHGLTSGHRLSEYGRQLREKQKVKRMYGLREKQFKKYFQKAQEQEGNTGERLIRLLERRLDNALYRSGLVPSRATARQLITHGHVLVNDNKVTFPSYQVDKGDEIRLNTKAQKMNRIIEWLKREEKPADWLQKKGFIAKVKKQPEVEDMITEIDESLIIEFYSR